MDPLELEINIQNTRYFISAKPTMIELTPQDKVKTPSGGYKMVDGPKRAAQMFRIIELGMNQTPPIVRLTDGTQREASFWLLGMPDAVVGINDWWEAADPSTGRIRQWLVGDIVRANGYEVRGLVTERGA